MRAHAPRTALLIVALCAVSAEGRQAQGPQGLPVERLLERRHATAQALAEAERHHLGFAGTDDALSQAAAIAWRYVGANYVPATGIIAAVPNYEYATVWDLASSLAALYAAGELGLLDRAESDARLLRALQTLQRLPLYQETAFNKVYSVRTGTMVDKSERRSESGYGWSTTDIGRLLVWLRIVGASREPLAGPAEAIARRLKYERLVHDGYLWGEDVDAAGNGRRYQEGQLGYEQYAARGFALWGQEPTKALDFDLNALPITVMGHAVAADLRQRDRLTSDPFVLSGIELGWEPREAALARAVLAAQQERFARTGIVTMAGEDAMSEAPHYFFYYGVFANNREFGIDVQMPGVSLDGPRWISTKAAFGWHALLPSAYTRRAIEAIRPAAGPAGWASGVYERGGSTNVPNINTAAVVLEAALFERLGRPLLIVNR